MPAPGVDFGVLAAFRSSTTGSGNFLGFLDLLSGGTVSNFSLLSMGVYPYITAQIILQLLIPIIPALQRRMEEDPREARKWQEKWTYYLAVPMAALSAIGQINIFNSLSLSSSVGQVILPFGFTSELWLSSLSVVFAMTAGTMFAIWLGELISEYGIRGQGLSLIIFAGIVARMPTNLARLLADADTRVFMLIFTLVIIILTVFAIVYVQQGRRNVPVMYPGRRMGNRMSMPVKGTLPLMVNLSGMIPLIFASAILQFPAILASFFTDSPVCRRCKFLYWSTELLWSYRYQQLGLLDNLLLNGSNFYILLYFCIVRPAELWREFKESWRNCPWCSCGCAYTKVFEHGSAAYYFGWRCFPWPCRDHAISTWFIIECG